MIRHRLVARDAIETPVVWAASALSVAAAFTHLWAFPVYLVDLWGYDTFLWWRYAALHLAVAAFQGLYGVALLRWPLRSLVAVGLAGNLTVLFLYAVVHTLGVPAYLGPRSGYVEPVTPLAAAEVSLELALVAALVALLPVRWRGRAVGALVFFVAALWLARFVEALS